MTRPLALALSLALLPLACFEASDDFAEEAGEATGTESLDTNDESLDTNDESPTSTSDPTSTSTSNGESPDTNGEASEPLCGNEVIEEGEACDGPNVGAANCLMSASRQQGEVTCTPQCTLDVGACYTCGDLDVDGPETCDGDVLGGYGCEDLGYQSGTLACSGDCLSFDVSGCVAAPSCGNGVIDRGEQCDAGDLAGQTCEGLGYTSGTLACNAGCGFDVSGCTTCGNEVLEAGEECDTYDFGNNSCFGQGFDGGELFCSGSCTIQTWGCCNWPECGQLP